VIPRGPRRFFALLALFAIPVSKSLVLAFASNGPPFCLTDAQIVKERSEPQEIVLHRPLEGFRVMAKPFDTHKQVLWLAREGQRVGRRPRHDRRVQPPSLASRGTSEMLRSRRKYPERVPRLLSEFKPCLSALKTPPASVPATPGATENDDRHAIKGNAGPDDRSRD
jgi:hypothetical protein